MRKPVAICFAGAVGCGKTPIANHLSWALGIPRYERDAIRNEVKETLAGSDKSTDSWTNVFDELAAKRQNELLQKRQDIILDASVDRTWKSPEKAFTKYLLEQHGYDYILISFDLSLEFLKKLYDAKAYTEFDHLERTHTDHDKFVSEHSTDVSLSIDEENYTNRLQACLDHVAAKLKPRV